MFGSWRAIYWKEYRELRWPLWIGSCLFLIFPGVMTANTASWLSSIPTTTNMIGHYKNFSPAYAAVVQLFGMPFVALTALAIVTRDLRDGLSAGWRAAPVRPSMLLATKFMVGLVVTQGLLLSAVLLHLLCAWYVGLSAGSLLGPNPDSIALRDTIEVFVLWLPMTLVVYAISFALASCIRPIICAAFLVVVTVALIWFLPLLWPTLSFMNLFDLVGKPLLWVFPPSDRPVFFSASTGPVVWWDYWLVYNRTIPSYLLTMLMLFTLASAAGIWLAVRGRRILLDAHRIAWSMGLLFLGLFSLAAVQVGNNLEPKMVVPFSESKMLVVNNLIPGRDGDVFVTGQLDRRFARSAVMRNTIGDWPDGIYTKLGNLHDPQSLTCGNRVSTDEATMVVDAPWQLTKMVWSPDDPAVAYVLASKWTWLTKNLSRRKELQLLTLRVGVSTDKAVIGQIDLLEAFGWTKELQDAGRITHHVQDGRLYVLHNLTKRGYPSRLLIFDLADATAPKLIDRVDYDYQWNPWWGSSGGAAGKSYTIRVPLVPRLDLSQRLELLWELAEPIYPFMQISEDRQLMVSCYGSLELEVYQRRSHRINESGDYLEYDMVARRRLTPLESWMQWELVDMALTDGLVFVISRGFQNGLWVFDVRDPLEPRKVGHYYAPGEPLYELAVTDDGHVIAAGTSLHVFDVAQLLNR